MKKKSTFNFSISPRIKPKKAKPFLNPFRLKPISKPRYVNQVNLKMPLPKVPYKRTQPERSLIRKNLVHGLKDEEDYDYMSPKEREDVEKEFSKEKSRYLKSRGLDEEDEKDKEDKD